MMYCKKIIAFLFLLMTVPVLAGTTQAAPKLDLKNTMVQLSAQSSTEHAKKKFKSVLQDLVNQSAALPAIAAIRIQASFPLDHQAMQWALLLASKAAWLSYDFSLQNASDWHALLQAQATNPILLTTVFGPRAMAQIAANVPLGHDFLHSAPLIQLSYLGPSHTKLAFWQAIAHDSQTHEENKIIVLLGPSTHSKNDAALATAILKLSSGHLIWIGGNDAKKIMPLQDHTKPFYIWRFVNNQINAYPSSYRSRPSELYLALGMNYIAYDILSNYIKRSAELEKLQVNRLAASKDNQAIFLNIDNTALLNENKLYFISNQQAEASPEQTNIILFNPNQKTLDNLLSSINLLLPHADHLRSLSLFDYSTVINPNFYKIIAPIIKYTQHIQLKYNALNEDNINLLFSQDYLVDHLDLGRKASELLLKIENKKSTCIELNTLSLN